VQLKLSDLPEGLQVSEGSTDSLPPVIFLNEHNLRPTFLFAYRQVPGQHRNSLGRGPGYVWDPLST